MEKIILKISKLDNEGKGISYYKDKIVFVPFTLPNEEVEVEIIKESKKYYEAKVIKYLVNSKERATPFCKYYGICGGCDLEHLSYENTLKYKKGKVVDIFNKFANQKIDPKVIASPSQNYRNKITLKVVNGCIGYYKRNSNDLIEIDSCYLANDNINNIIPKLKELNIQNGEIIIRVNKEGKILLSIITQDKIALPKFDVEGIVLNGKLICGNDYLIETVGDKDFKISYNSFFQINNYINKELMNILKSNVDKNDIILDLYCGVGSLGISVADKVNKVYGIEIIENAIKNAEVNAKLNKVNTAVFYVGDVKKLMPQIKDKISLTILDPPRAGVDKNVLSLINSDKIVYIACDAVTMARDIKILSEKYEIIDSYILDMFPYTKYVETVIVLYKIAGSKVL